jgi:protocatechuate 3,4-dioxygenase beta subunit
MGLGAVCAALIAGIVALGRWSEPKLDAAATAGGHRNGALPGPSRITHDDDEHDDDAEGGDSEDEDGEPERDATLRLIVVGDGAPIAGATVSVDFRTRATTDATGRAGLAVPDDRYHHDDVRAENWARESLRIDHDELANEQSITLRRGAPVSGIVLGPDGRPVANAKITMSQTQDRRDMLAMIDGVRTLRARLRTSSDDSGQWRIDVVAAGSYSVEASTETLGPTDELTLELDGKTAKQGIVVRVDPNSELVGTVVDSTGRAVAEADVEARSGKRRERAETDTSGRFVFRAIRHGDWEVSAGEGQRASTATKVALGRHGRAEVRLVLEPASIAGIVVDTDGQPVFGIRVIAEQRKDGELVDLESERTDANGRFEFDSLNPGEYSVAVVSEHRSSRSRARGSELTVRTGTQDAKIVLPKPPLLSGRVVLDGKPVSHFGVSVTDTPKARFFGRPVNTRAADGRFALRDFEPGTWTVVIQAEGTARTTIADVQLEAGRTTDLGDVALTRGQRITGRVRDGRGAPIAGATVRVGSRVLRGQRDAVDQAFAGIHEVTTDSSGAYRIEGVTADGRATIVAHHPQHGGALPQTIPSGDATIDFVLVDSGEIHGTIDGDARGLYSVSASHLATGAELRTTVDRDGSFVFQHVPPGEYQVGSTIVLPGRVPPLPVTVRVVAGQQSRVRLAMPGPGVTLTVKPVGGTCKVAVLSPPGDGPARKQMLSVQTCDPTAEFQHVPPGEYRACLDNKRCHPITVAAEPKQQTVEITVIAPGVDPG